MSSRSCLALFCLAIAAALPARADRSMPPQVRVDVKFLEVTDDFIRNLGVRWTDASKLPVPPVSSVNPAPVTSTVRGNRALALVLGIDPPQTEAKPPPPPPGGLDIATLAQNAQAIEVLIEATGKQDGARVLAQRGTQSTAGAINVIRLGGNLEIPPKGGQRQARFDGFGINAQIGAQVLSDPNLIQIRWNDSVDGLKQHSGNAFIGVPTSFERVTYTHAFEAVVPADGTLLIRNLFPSEDADLTWDVAALGQLPVLGSLFGSADFRKGRSQLVAMVTPYIVAPATRQAGGTLSATAGLEPDDDEVPPPQVLIRSRIIELSGRDQPTTPARDPRLDVPQPQVNIEARIIELSHDFAKDLGIPWVTLDTGAAQSKPGTPATATLEGAVLSQSAQPLASLLEATQGQSEARILGSPSVATTDGASGRIDVGGALQIPAERNRSPASFPNFGIHIDTAPRIADDGTILIDLNIATDWVYLRPGNAFVGIPSVPELRTRTATGSVAVPAGESLLIGGLLQKDDRDSASRVPALAGVPVLGALFAQRDFQRGERDLVLVVTPHLTGSSGPSRATRSAAAELPPELQQAPKQVLIESRVLETSQSSANDLGIGLTKANDCLRDSDLRTVSLGETPSFVESVVKSQAEGLLGGLFGGSVGGGFGGGDSGGFGPGTPMSGGSGSSAPSTDPNPLKGAPGAKVKFADGLGFELQAIDGGPGMTLGVRIDPDAVKDRKLTFSNFYLIDPQCGQVQPSGRFVYEIWQDRKFSFHIEFWRWRDGQLVEHWSRAGSREWSERLASGAFPIWLGARFDGVTPERLAQGGWSLVTTWTYEKGKQVLLESRVFDLWGDEDAARNATKVPVLGEVPVLGRLFRSQSSDEDKRNLLVFITPRIVQESSE